MPSSEHRQQSLQVLLATAAVGVSTLLYYWRKQDTEGIPENISDNAKLVAQSWSPQRRSRRTKKFLGLKGGPLRGGDFVLTADGSAATCSFCFSVGAQRYGVTTGHLAPIGDPLFVFTGIGNEVRMVGTVVSVSRSTDSLVFSVSSDIPALDLRLPGKSILGEGEIVLPAPNAHLLHPEKTALFGYGAQRRGGVGLVTTPTQERQCGFCLPGSIGITNTTGLPITDKGDCGTIFIDEAGLFGPSMHYLIWHRDNGTAESFGIPLASIVANHVLLGGSHDLSVPQNVALHEQQRDFGHQSHDLASFQIKIKGEYSGQSLDIAPPMKLSFK